MVVRMSSGPSIAGADLAASANVDRRKTTVLKVACILAGVQLRSVYERKYISEIICKYHKSQMKLQDKRGDRLMIFG